MRPVNLIPPEDRRGDRAPLRAGALSYVVVGAFVAVLIAVVGLVLTQNSITERENEIAELEVTRDAAAQQAEALAPYAEFAALQLHREATITSLAKSRFDWERVLRELALVIPADVTLESLEASTAGESDDLAAAANGGSAPSLTMSGCARNHESVAAFVAALKDIDGVTRVGLTDSARSADAEGSQQGGAAPATGDGGECFGESVVTYSLQAVFDNAVAALAPVTVPVDPAPVVAAETNSQEEQAGEADQAASLVQGVAR
ncbi:MAG: PilN domain-containing protein [Actinomycetota bacterium]|nr:PilN domain-containing protein [Actinomycetota bacterium]